MAKERTKTHILKKNMIEALTKSLGVVTTACKSVSIDRRRHYEWLDNDEQYKADVESLKDVALDFAESQLHKRIQSGSDTAIIFFLKTQGRSRGYIEKQEIEQKIVTELPKMSWND